MMSEYGIYINKFLLDLLEKFVYTIVALHNYLQLLKVIYEFLLIYLCMFAFQLGNVGDHVLVEGSDNSGDGAMKYMQVIDSGKGMMVDLLNLTLVQ